MKARSNQGGSVVSFIVIGVALVLVAGGLLYGVRQSSNQAPEAPGVTQPIKNDEKKPATPRDTTPQKPASDAPTTTETPSAASQAPATAPAAQPEVDQLSHTGPAETVRDLLILSTLSGVIVAFIRSRQPRSSL